MSADLRQAATQLRDGGRIPLHSAVIYNDAVADLLDAIADQMQLHVEAWQSPGSFDAPPAIAWNAPEVLAKLIEHHFGKALAIAAAVLGEPSTGQDRGRG